MDADAPASQGPGIMTSPRWLNDQLDVLERESWWANASVAERLERLDDSELYEDYDERIVLYRSVYEDDFEPLTEGEGTDSRSEA
jgi:hypothetical protein